MPGAVYPVVDHIFICTAPGAPAAELLQRAGLAEGTPNRHPGQGTACRRFFFSNAMLELLWLEDEAQVRSDQTRATRLWERLSGARSVSPLGVILRPAQDSETACPWRSWSYRPQTMPGLELEIAADTDLEEPMWCYMKNGRPAAEWPQETRPQLEHPAGFREITSVLIGCPKVTEGSVTSVMSQSRVIALQAGVEHVLEIQFDAERLGTVLDFRPDLPLVFRT